ncbi:N-acetyltransferase family protein [Sphingomonas sp.]|uniref:GNAT family N-acetyltransferase n=1 Tax=Sphingomonas sp. TaxID=28214 RepID=UPI003D6C8816
MNERHKVTLRLARPTDSNAMKVILQDTFESVWRPNISPAAAAAYLDEDRGGAYVDQHGHEFRVAELDGEVAGLVHWQDDFIHALHVGSAYRRHGIGLHLMDLAEKGMAQSGIGQARLETDTFNEPSRAFYEACGYIEAGRYPDEEWNSDLTTILFVKQLR